MVLLILRKRRLAALALAVLAVGIGLLWLPQRLWLLLLKLLHESNST